MFFTRENSELTQVAVPRVLYTTVWGGLERLMMTPGSLCQTLMATMEEMFDCQKVGTKPGQDLPWSSVISSPPVLSPVNRDSSELDVLVSA